MTPRSKLNNDMPNAEPPPRKYLCRSLPRNPGVGPFSKELDFPQERLGHPGFVIVTPARNSGALLQQPITRVDYKYKILDETRSLALGRVRFRFREVDEHHTKVVGIVRGSGRNEISRTPSARASYIFKVRRVHPTIHRRSIPVFGHCWANR